METLEWTFEELGRGKNKSLDVVLLCSIDEGCPGDRWTPPEPPQSEVRVARVPVLASDSEIAVGTSWLPWLISITNKLAEEHQEEIEEFLFEHVANAEEAARDDYYDLKRREMIDES